MIAQSLHTLSLTEMPETQKIIKTSSILRKSEKYKLYYQINMQLNVIMSNNLKQIWQLFEGLGVEGEREKKEMFDKATASQWQRKRDSWQDINEEIRQGMEMSDQPLNIYYLCKQHTVSPTLAWFTRPPAESHWALQQLS